MQFQTTLSPATPYRIGFVPDALTPDEPMLARAIGGRIDDPPTPVLAMIDDGLLAAQPDLPERLHGYARFHASAMRLVVEPVALPGGEACKNGYEPWQSALRAIHRASLDRWGCVLAIGGGAFLDCAGFAAATAHRGVRLVRMPSTTLAQADSGVGVKNGINAFGQKNYLGVFAVPWAVVNDASLLGSLAERDWIGGFSEAVKVALLKDPELFNRIEVDAEAIAQRDRGPALPVIERSALLHAQHIAIGGDPFETTAARPLDFGHWAAHRLEVLSGFALRHGQAVAIGLALDCLYAHLSGMLGADELSRVLGCLRGLGFELYHRALADEPALWEGLEQFRQHLGGRLTVTLIRGIGKPLEVHEIDRSLFGQALGQLQGVSQTGP